MSDGLIGDLKKLLGASGVGAELDLECVPMSDALRSCFAETERTRFALTGGDDYELCFTAARDAVANMADITAIGTVTADERLVCRRHGDIVEYDDSGYRHFQ